MSRGLFLACLIVAAVGASLVMGVIREGADPYLPGDCPYYAAATESLLHDGDLNLANQIAPGKTGDELRAELRNHNSFYAVAPDGAIVPKVSTLISFAALPFYALLGKPGFLVFNILQLTVLASGIATLAGGTPSARLLALVGCLISPFLPYTFNFSPDLFGAALVVWCYIAATRQRWFACGLLAGLSVWAKIYLAPIVLPAGLLVFASPGEPMSVRTRVLVAIVAGLLGVAPFFATNAVLYGHPLVTGYDREGHVTDDGQLITMEHYSRFNQPILTGLGNLLFDVEHKLGATWTAPIWSLWPLGAIVAWRTGRRLWTIALVSGVMANLLVFAPYDMWEASMNGNRFLFPAFALGLAVQGPLWETVAARWKRSRPGVELGVVEQFGERQGEPRQNGAAVERVGGG